MKFYKLVLGDHTRIEGKCKNKEQLRKDVLNHPEAQRIVCVEYNKRFFTMSDIYAGR